MELFVIVYEWKCESFNSGLERSQRALSLVPLDIAEEDKDVQLGWRYLSALSYIILRLTGKAVSWQIVQAVNWERKDYI